MKTADWALVISMGSFLISVLSFVWNVWSKFVYPKARVRPTIGLMTVLGRGEKGREFISLSVTNYGPTDVTLHVAISKRKQPFFRLRKNTKFALLNPLDNIDSNSTSGPFSGGLPKKLLVGEQFSVYFPASAGKKWLEEDGLSNYGFSDTFGRNHWCSMRDIKDFRKQASYST